MLNAIYLTCQNQFSCFPPGMIGHVSKAVSCLGRKECEAGSEAQHVSRSMRGFLCLCRTTEWGGRGGERRTDCFATQLCNCYAHRDEVRNSSGEKETTHIKKKTGTRRSVWGCLRRVKIDPDRIRAHAGPTQSKTIATNITQPETQSKTPIIAIIWVSRQIFKVWTYMTKWEQSTTSVSHSLFWNTGKGPTGTGCDRFLNPPKESFKLKITTRSVNTHSWLDTKPVLDLWIRQPHSGWCETFGRLENKSVSSFAWC